MKTKMVNYVSKRLLETILSDVQIQIATLGFT